MPEEKRRRITPQPVLGEFTVWPYVNILASRDVDADRRELSWDLRAMNAVVVQRSE